MRPGLKDRNASWAAHIGVEGDGAKIGGLKVWEQKWRSSSDEPVLLAHPNYSSQKHSFSIYEIDDGTQVIRFAAAELSADVYGFYTPV